IISAPTSTAARTCSMFCTWQINLAPAPLTRGANGTGDPNDSITAAGECASTSPSNIGRLASDQVIKPQPTRVFRASANSRSSHSASPYPPPIRPSPPAAVRDTHPDRSASRGYPLDLRQPGSPAPAGNAGGVARVLNLNKEMARPEGFAPQTPAD